MGPEELYDLLSEFNRLKRAGQIKEGERLIVASPIGQTALDRGYLERSAEGFELTKAGQTLLGG